MMLGDIGRQHEATPIEAIRQPEATAHIHPSQEVAREIAAFDRESKAAGDEAVAVLNHNAPVAYVLSPKMMGDLLDLVADKLVEQRALDRMATLASAKSISLTDL